MKIKRLVFAVATAALLSGCTSGIIYSEGPVPSGSIDQYDDGNRGWEPYGGRHSEPDSRQAQPNQGNWNPPRPAPRTTVEHAELPPVRDFQTRPSMDHVPTDRTPLERATAPNMPTPIEDSAFKRVEPKDPPTDLATRRRTYSSRPEKNETVPRPTSVQPTTVIPLVGSNVKSEWADKAIQPDNRPGFDAMIRDSSRLGNGSFEDETGRIYYGEKKSREGKCTVVEVTVTTKGGLPIVARGTAYAC